MKLTFSGHESFHCRPVWIKKGYEFFNKHGSIKEVTAWIELGVGKNMANSINYWFLSFGLFDEQNKTSELANYLFDKTGKDQFLEDSATLWLLHYLLVSNHKASIYNLVFNEFRKTRTEFTKEHILRFLEKTCSMNNTVVSSQTLKRDIDVLLKNYVSPVPSNKNIEENYTGMFLDLGLISQIDKIDGKTFWYSFNINSKEEIPIEIILYSIINTYPRSRSISFDNLAHGEDSIGNIFLMTEEGIHHKINNLVYNYKSITFTEDAGIRELQFKKTIDTFSVLNNYYEKNK